VKSSSETSSIPASHASAVQEPASDMPLLKASPQLPTKLPDDRKDSTMDEEQLPSVPVPFVVVEKVADQDHPAYGDVEPVHLPEGASKRAADAEPDFEEVEADTAVETTPPKSPEIPLLVVEKTDDKPAYGDDFGEDATNAQKVAHDMRGADASPDRLVITPESHVDPGNEDQQAATLFRYESFQDDVSAASSMDTTDDVMTDQTSSADAIDTPPELDEAQDNDDELLQGPLLSHETGFGNKSSELEDGPLLPHEAESDADDADKLDEAPLLAHETSLHEDDEIASDGEEDELDRFPLMSHESGFSSYKGSEIRTDSDFGDEYPRGMSMRAYDDDVYDYTDHDDGDVPLLPHERDSAVASNAGSDYSHDEAPFSLQNQPTFGYETDNARELFGGTGRANIFRARTSSLPHKLPQSDAEDENLNDPSLERFPTSRQQILERVRTIGLHLPEDDAMHDHPQSPEMSVLSQACSSVDLAPVKSYTSLAAVPEAEYSDDEEDQDVESLPSPVYISQKHSRITSGSSIGSSDFARDPHATPMPDESKQLGFSADDKNEASSNHSRESSEAESVDKHDGAKDVSSVLSAKHNRIQDRGDFRGIIDAISTPTKAMSPSLGPVTPDSKTTAKEEHPVSNLDSELRQRRERVEKISQSEEVESTAIDGASIEDKIIKATLPTLARQPDNRKENMLQHYIRVVFGPVGRFLTACVGDRKRAR
jgi:hypothetical protein